MKILLCGMGSRHRGDDGFGPYVIEHAQAARQTEKIDCSLYPENYIGRMMKSNPDLVIFFDAVKDGDRAFTILKNEEIIANNPISVSSHNLPFSAIYQCLREGCGCEVFLLGVTPRSYVEFSKETKILADRLCGVLSDIDKLSNISIMKIYEKLSATFH